MPRGILVSESIKRAIVHIVCLALLVAACLVPGTFVTPRANAQQLKAKPAKVSSDLFAKAHSLTNSDTVKVIVQLRAPITSGLNSLLNSNGVHLRKTLY